MSEPTQEQRRELLALEIYAEQVAEERSEAVAALREYGRDAIKGLLLLNGGAVLALLAFLGALFSKGEGTAIRIAGVALYHLGPAFWCFAIGAISAVVMSGLGYLNWMAVATETTQTDEIFSFVRVYKVQAERKPLIGRAITVTAWLAIGLSVVSLAFFVWGVWLVSKAFAAMDQATLIP